MCCSVESVFNEAKCSSTLRCSGVDICFDHESFESIVIICHLAAHSESLFRSV